jgi:hypothetical protein
MVRLIPADEINKELRNAKGWLDNDASFFDEIDRMVQDRTKHVPRVLQETSTE